MVEVTIPDELAAKLRAKEHDETTDLSVLVARAVTTVLEEEAKRLVDRRRRQGLPERGGPTDGEHTPK